MKWPILLIHVLAVRSQPLVDDYYFRSRIPFSHKRLCVLSYSHGVVETIKDLESRYDNRETVSVLAQLLVAKVFYPLLQRRRKRHVKRPASPEATLYSKRKRTSLKMQSQNTIPCITYIPSQKRDIVKDDVIHYAARGSELSLSPSLCSPFPSLFLFPSLYLFSTSSSPIGRRMCLVHPPFRPPTTLLNLPSSPLTPKPKRP